MRFPLSKRWMFIVLKLAIAGIAMVVLVQKVSLGRIYSALQNPTHPELIYLAGFLLIPNLWIQWYRWHYLLKRVDTNTPVFESVSSLFGGMVVGFITPGRIGELGRFLFLSRVDRIGALGLVFIDKLYSFAIIVIGGLWGLFLFFGRLSAYAPFVIWPLSVLMGLISLGIVLVLLHPEWIRNAIYHFGLLFPHRDKLKRLTACFDPIRPHHARVFLGLSILMYGVFITQFCLFAFAFERLSVLDVYSATTATFFAKTLLPVSFADLGIREGAAVFFFMQYHADKVTAFNSAILLFATNVLLPAVLGLVFLPRLGVKTHR